MVRRRVLAAAAATLGAVVATVLGAGPLGPGAVADDLPPGVEQVALDGRAYLLAAPASGSAGLPLVVLLHGRTDSASRFLGESGLLGWVTAGAAVVAAPLTAPGLSPTSWNAGRCCDGAVAGAVDDVGLVAGVIADVAERTGADIARVSVIGFSNGAMLGYRVACERPDLLAGLVAVAGARLVACDGAGGAAVLHVHGSDDRAVPVAGLARSALTGARLPSAEESVTAFSDGRLEVLPGVGHRFTGTVAGRAAAWLAGRDLLVSDLSATRPPRSPST